MMESINPFWFSVPLIVSISLVYAATRHEKMRSIFYHSLGVAGWIVGFMAAIFVVIWFVCRGL